jgi:nitrite reductase/ring-hydroxylating ferredoxin subunit
MTDVHTRPDDAGLERADVIEVATAEQVPRDRGVAVLVRSEGVAVPVALFRLSPLESGDDDDWYAIGHIEPQSGAPVMARGLVGSVERDDQVVPTVASPLLKQRYDLRTGTCLDDETLRLPVYPVRVEQGRVLLGLAPDPQ